MATHLTISLLLSCTNPIGPTTMPPNAFIASISNSRLNPSGLPHATSTLILAELPSSVDKVTIPSPQHRKDMPPIVIMSTIALLQDQHQSASMIVHEQSVSISAEHFEMLTAGSAAFTSWWGRRLTLMLCLLFHFPNSPRPSVQSHHIRNNVSHASGSLLLCDPSCCTYGRSHWKWNHS